MKDKAISPAVTGVIIALIVVVIVIMGWKSLGPRTDGPTEPIDLSKHMGGSSGGPPKGGSVPGGPLGGNGAIKMGGNSAGAPGR
ncbi:MAG: hypothetical protein JWL77_381 [Chthonomonadaceae bacterium]|nr:hypothetical protein [Chthonomonadaceae bacterium]